MAKEIFKIITDETHPIFKEGGTITTHHHTPIETRKRWLKEKEMLEENSNAQDS